MQLYEMPWPAVDALPRTTPVLLPIAALEQHGRHMPVFTDSLLLGEVVRRVDQAMNERILTAPLQWLGNSEHHLDFCGTMTADPRGYLDLLRNMAENFLFHGFTRIVFLNGHGGNIVPSQQVVFELRQKYRQRSDLLLLASTYWTLGSKPHEGSNIRQNRMGHACEWETSMMLRIRPDLVHNHTQVDEVPFGNAFEPANRGWITKDRSPAGHIGNPKEATAEKGEQIFTAFTRDVMALLERVLRWDGKSWEG